MEKIFSMTSEPLMRLTRSGTSTVMTLMRVLRSACLSTSLVLDTPFEAASSMKSEFMMLIISERV